MNRLSKSFLVASLTTLGVGLFVSFTHTPLPLFLTLALPMSAVFYGLFLISFVFQREFALTDREERGGSQSPAAQKDQSAKEESRDVAEKSPHRPAHA
jgi:hypothetical protein